MTYIQVNIGRNVGGEPMGGFNWAVFQGKVKQAICDAVAGNDHPEEWETIHRSIEVHYGAGNWDGETEESAHLSVFIGGTVNGITLDYLRALLRELKRDYCQDAIALITDSELI